MQSIKNCINREAGIDRLLLIPVEKNEIPKTSIGKIQREILKSRLIKGEFRKNIINSDIFSKQNRVFPRWFHQAIFSRRELCESSMRKKLNISVISYSKVILDDCKNILTDFYHDSVVFFDKVTECLDHLEQEDNCYLCYLFEQESEILAPDLWYERVLFHVNNLYLLKKSKRLAAVNQLVFLFFGNNNLLVYRDPILFGVYSALMCFYKETGCKIKLLYCSKALSSTKITSEILAKEDDFVFYDTSQRRYTFSLKEIVWRNTNFCPPIKDGDYILAGGLGGIRYLWCDFLLRFFSCNLILIGSSISPNEQFLTLEQQYPEADLMYICCDLSLSNNDEKLLMKSKNFLSTHKLQGIFHFSGFYGKTNLSEVDEEIIKKEILVKLVGAHILSKLLLHFNPNAQLYLISSVTSILGGVNVLGYSIANGLLESFQDYAIHHYRIDTRCIAFSQWDKIGMSLKLVPEFSLDKDNNIKGKQGIDSLYASLSLSKKPIYIGLNKKNLIVSKNFHNKISPLDSIELLIESSKEEKFTRDLCDRFGISLGEHLNVRGANIEHFLYSSNQLSLSKQKRKNGVVSFGDPNNQVEREVCSIFKETIKISSILMNENIFNVGIDSINILQFIGNINENFNINTILFVPYFEGYCGLDSSNKRERNS